jgi:hypothetical protein
MPIDDLRVVDAISLDPHDIVNLTIFDAWDWTDESGHLLMIQEKINTYFNFIQSGQLLEAYPNAAGKKILINLITPDPIPPQALELLRRADALAMKLNARVGHQVQPFDGAAEFTPHS